MASYHANVVPDIISSSVNLSPGTVGSYKHHGPDDGHSHGHSPVKGTIHPFFSPNRTVVGTIIKELTSILNIKETRKILVFLFLNVIGTFTLFMWCHDTNSMALTAYTYLTLFDMFSLLTCLLSIWVSRQKPSPAYSFGYERFEVLAMFASTMLAILGSFFIIKESIERVVQQPEIHTGRMLVGLLFAFVLHMMITYSINNRAMTHVVEASSSSWLQEHMTDMSETVCHLLPGLSKLLLPRMNPFALIAFAGGVVLFVTHIIIDTKNYFSADTFAAVGIAIMTMGTMFPMSVYTGKILLQTTPSHILGQLDKVLREASTLDGVLEFRHEHFWTLSFGTLAGSVQVRVRRDADEQLVLAHVYSRLSSLVPILTVQIFKDDWSRPTYNLMGNPAFSQNYPHASGVLTPPRVTSPTNEHSHSHLASSGHSSGTFKPSLVVPSNFGDYQHSASHVGMSDHRSSMMGPGGQSAYYSGQGSQFSPQLQGHSKTKW